MVYAHSIHNPDGVRFVGPLAPLAAELKGEFVRLGYATSSATVQLQLAADVSRWLQAEGLGTDALTGPVIERFLAARRRDYRNHYSMQALEPLLAYLRRVGAAPEPVAPEPCSGGERLLARFGEYLSVDRGLTAPVIEAYKRLVRPFVEQAVGAGQEADLGDLAAEEVQRFLVANLPGLSRKSAQMTACALRSFLGFCYVEGIVAVSLAEAVPAVAHRKLSGLPEGLTAGQVESLLDACDRHGPVGLRDYAVIVCLHRLGLRCAETAGLMLDDIDWETATLSIHGKGGRTDRLPLPVDVGQALVDYLRHGRPDTSSRAVFVRAYAPFTALGRSGLSCIVARAARRAGLGIVHAHRLRHTAATRTLNAGASLEEVAQLLRHAGTATTLIYAKTDQRRLAGLVRRWPTAGDVA
jgi:integrase/recombinase XerD